MGQDLTRGLAPRPQGRHQGADLIRHEGFGYVAPDGTRGAKTRGTQVTLNTVGSCEVDAQPEAINSTQPCRAAA